MKELREGGSDAALFLLRREGKVVIAKNGVPDRFLIERRTMMRIALDTETTGMNPGRGDEILSLSIVDGDGDVLFDGFFKPRNKATWESASRINSINPDDVEDCPSIDDCLDEIQGIIDSADEIVMYNARFDKGFLESAGVEFGYGTRIVDTMLEFSKAMNDHDGRHGHTGWFKLTEATAIIGYQWTGAAHGSLADARATLAVQEWLDERQEEDCDPF